MGQNLKIISNKIEGAEELKYSAPGILLVRDNEVDLISKERYANQIVTYLKGNFELLVTLEFLKIINFLYFSNLVNFKTQRYRGIDLRLSKTLTYTLEDYKDFNSTVVEKEVDYNSTPDKRSQAINELKELLEELNIRDIQENPVGNSNKDLNRKVTLIKDTQTSTDETKYWDYEEEIEDLDSLSLGSLELSKEMLNFWDKLRYECNKHRDYIKPSVGQVKLACPIFNEMSGDYYKDYNEFGVIYQEDFGYMEGVNSKHFYCKDFESGITGGDPMSKIQIIASSLNTENAILRVTKPELTYDSFRPYLYEVKAHKYESTE